jgi:TIR domain/WD domain, G-beta repeat
VGVVVAEATQKDNKLNVFISYSRDDLGFSDQLDAALAVAGFDTTLDRRGISAGEDWKSRLSNLIRDTDTVVFVLSPASARSEICAWEVGEAITLRKRIIPVLSRPLDGATPPPQLADLDYIFFYEEPRSARSGFGTGLGRLVAALNTDLDWLREHTRYLQRATEWDAGGRPANRLLYGSDIASAKTWAANRPKAAPEPTALHLDFIRASEAQENRQQSAEAQRLRQLAEVQAEREAAFAEKAVAQAEREAAFAERAAAQEREADARRSEAESQKREAEQARRVVRRTRAGLGVVVVLAAAAGWFGVDASNQKEQALAAATEATNQTARAQAYVAQIYNDKERYFEAAQAALRGLTNPLTLDTNPAQTAPWSELVRATAANGFLVPPLHHDGLVRAAMFDATGERVVTASDDKTARIWDARTGEPIGETLHHDGVVWAAMFDTRGERVVTASDDNTARIWDARTGEPIGKPLHHDGRVKAAMFDANGGRVVTTSFDKTARIWDARTGEPIDSTLEHDDRVQVAMFDATG